MSFELSTSLRGVSERIVGWLPSFVSFVNISSTSLGVADAFWDCKLLTTNKTRADNPSYPVHFNTAACDFKRGTVIFD